MIIREFRTDKPWRYLWGKKVTGVKLYVHCATCLNGSYEPSINADTTELHDVEIDSKVFYLCGVAKPYCWEKNFHLALIEKEGAETVVERNGIYVRIEGAEELPINFDYDKCTHPKKMIKGYGTCRNWQFAYLYKDLFNKKE